MKSMIENMRNMAMWRLNTLNSMQAPTAVRRTERDGERALCAHSGFCVCVCVWEFQWWHVQASYRQNYAFRSKPEREEGSSTRARRIASVQCQTMGGRTHVAPDIRNGDDGSFSHMPNGKLRDEIFVIANSQGKAIFQIDNKTKKKNKK